MFEFLWSKRKPTASEIKIHPVVLLILDGWGVAPASYGNAISQAKTPNMNKLLSLYPHGELLASGESVGLPANEVGNTEVGHLTIGSGRVILQSLKRITQSIEDGSFFENKGFKLAYEHVVKNGSTLHLMGLVGTGNVHSSVAHLYKLLEYYKQLRVEKVCLHLFTDGRDSPPKEAVDVVSKLEEYLKSIKMGKIATIGGRYFGMDRDRRWERTQKAYEAIVQGKGRPASSAVEAIEQSYQAGVTDEFIEPTVITENGSPVGSVADGDAVVFFNFRIDRPKQLTMAFVLPDFENLRDFEFGYEPDQGKVKQEKVKGPTFVREKILKNLCFVTMTEYQQKLPVSGVAFPLPKIPFSLSEVIAKAGMRQLHIAESEKERMVTFYFNGLREEKFSGEDYRIVPSPKVASYDKRPEMSVFKIVGEFEKAVLKQEYGFVVMNFANPDMVAHTGNLPATIKACEATDKALGQIVEMVLAYQGALIVTADHGNAEDLLTFPTGTFFYTTARGDLNTDHSNNPVPVIFVGKQFEGVKKVIPKMSLADVAPTVLKLLNLKIPEAMKGTDILVQ